jgi:hypothetical protein
VGVAFIEHRLSLLIIFLAKVQLLRLNIPLGETCNGIFMTSDTSDTSCLHFADDVACGTDIVHNLPLQLNAVSELVIVPE